MTAVAIILILIVLVAAGIFGGKIRQAKVDREKYENYERQTQQIGDFDYKIESSVPHDKLNRMHDFWGFRGPNHAPTKTDD
jgi:hypothetical protein